MNPSEPIREDKPTGPVPVGEASGAFLALLAKSEQRAAELDRLRAEVRALHEKHAAALMEMQSVIQRAYRLAEVQTADATTARGQAAVLARCLREMIVHVQDNARSAGWGALPEKQAADMEDAREAIKKWDDANE